MSDVDLDILLIEDNPGDARLIEEMLRDARELLQRVDVGASAGVPKVHHEQELSVGLERLSELDADVVLLDLGLPDSTGLATLDRVVEVTEYVPIVVLTGLDDQQVGIEAIQRGAQDYLVKDEATADLLVRTIHHAIERNRQDRERARRREQLEALNRLNRISQDVTHTVITTSTREELERAVCERLADSDAYEFAWIGEVNRGTDRVSPRVGAGVEEGYLDAVDITVEGGDTAGGPTGRAVQTHEVQVVQDVQSDPSFEPWREAARERGYHASAAVPIAHEGLLYAVLNIYAPSPDAFSEPEVDILSRLGDVIGHAIGAMERKDALVNDTVLELEFQVDGAFEELVALSANRGGTIESDTLVRSDDALLVYGYTREIPPEELRDAAERTDTIDDLRVLSEGDTVRFELVTATARSLVDAVASHGGRVDSVTIQGGEFRIVVGFPPGGDRRKLVELVEDHCPDATPVAQRTVDRSDRSVADSRSVLENDLTEKQRTTLETAYFGGYFDWPRESTGEELAERLGITPATFTQHIRTAERKFFDAVFQSER